MWVKASSAGSAGGQARRGGRPISIGTHVSLLIAMVVTLAGCGSANSLGVEQTGARTAQTAAPKRITAAILSEPPVLASALLGGGPRPLKGIEGVEWLLSAGVAMYDVQGALHPQLAEAVPTLENGLWRVLPDGRMETTWRVRANARWHDGTPVTSDDLIFTLEVWEDKELPFRRGAAFDIIESVGAPDSSAVTVRWHKPFLDADTLFTFELALPQPKHLLQAAYAENKRTFAELPYWSDQFVGAGPYKLREFARNSHLVMEANENYVLGRPRIDEIIVRFIPDPNALLANILAGTVDLTLGLGISLDQGMQAQDRWKAGRMEIMRNYALSLWPQLLSPSPAVIGDVQFRRALLHALDRQQLADSLLQRGLSAVAHGVVAPHEADYREVEASIVRYEYDPRRATQLIEELGYTRRAGEFFRDAGGQRFAIEIRTDANVDMRMKVMLATADYWQGVGVGVETVGVPPQQGRDREYQATRPGFELTNAPYNLRFIGNRHSSLTPLPANNFLGANRTRYINAEYDGLIEKYLTTISKPERLGLVRELARHTSDRVLVLGLFYDVDAVLIGDRIVGVTAPAIDTQASQSWNAHEWDVKTD